MGTEQASGTLTIHRPDGGLNQLALEHDLIVFVDGNEIGRIANHQLGDFALAPGTHEVTVRLALNFYEGGPLTVQIVPGTTTTVSCTANGPDGGLAALIHPTRFFSLALAASG